MKMNYFKMLVAIFMASALGVFAADYTLRLEQEGATLSKEGYDYAKINVYALFDADVQTITVNLNTKNAENFVFNKDDSGFNQGVKLDGTESKGYNAKKNTAYISITGKQGTASIAQCSKEILLGTFMFDLSSEMELPTDEQVFTMAASVMGTDGKMMTSKDSTSSISVTVIDAFYFAWNETTISTDEDTAFVLNSSNLLTYFDSQEYNVKTGKMVDCTDVTFSEAEIYLPTRAAAENATAEVSADGKSITISPAQYQYGSYLLKFKATHDGSTKAVEDVIVEVTAVNHEPVIAVSDFIAQENAELSFSFTCEDEGESYQPTNYTVEFNGVSYEGTIVGTEAGYTFTSNGTIPFETVAHTGENPSTATLEFSVTDEGKDDKAAKTATVEKSAQVHDTDRIQSVAYATLTLTPSTEITVESTVIASANGATDADGDTISYEYAARKSGEDIELQWQTSRKFEVGELGKKGEVIEVYARTVTEPFGEKKTVELSDPESFTIGNSKPVVTVSSNSVFIQKGEATSAEITLTFSDADGADDFKEYIVSENSALNVTVTGDTVAIAVKDTATELIGETFTVKAKDNSDVESDAITISVNYQEDPAPVIGEIAIDGTLKENEVITATVTAADTDTAVAPSGINVAKIKWTLYTVGAEGREPVSQDVLMNWIIDNEPAAATAGTGAVTSKLTFGLNYDAIEHPLAEDKFVLVFEVADGNGATATKTSEVMSIADVDRLPAAPEELKFDSASYTAESEKISASAKAGADEDDDEAAVEFTGAYSADGTSFTEIADIEVKGSTAVIKNNREYFKKGYTIKVAAKTVTKPYNAAAAYSDAEEITTVIGNTAPVLASVEQDGKTLTVDEGAVDVSCSERTTDEAADKDGFKLTVTAKDIDVDDALDELTWSAELSNSEAGEVEPIADVNSKLAMSFKFVPAQYYNTVDVNEKLYITITAKDKDKASFELKANVTVTEVNSAPVIAAADQYILPADMGKEMSFTVETISLGDKYEDAAQLQTLTGKTIEVVAGSDDIFEEEPAFAKDGEGIVVKYTVSSDVELGKKAQVRIVAEDDGTTDGKEDAKSSNAIVVSFYTSATPWYPIISFDCEETYDGYTVSIKNGERVNTVAINESRKAVMPADYYNSDVAAYAPNAALKVTVYPADSKTPCVEEFDYTVSDYGLPGSASSSGEVVAEVVEGNNTGKVTLPEISVPMAQHYMLEVVRVADSKVVVREEDEFAPAADALMILPVIKAHDIQLQKDGDYQVRVTGYNPAGTGDATVLANLDFTLTGVAVFAWPVDETGAPDLTNFKPADGTTLTNGTNITFSWPSIPWAVSYTVFVMDEGGRMVTRKTTSTTSATLDVCDDEDEPTNYYWFVRAVNAEGDKVASGNVSLIICDEDEVGYPVPAAVTFYDDNRMMVVDCAGMALNESAIVKFDYQLYSAATDTWTSRKGIKAAVTEDGTGYTFKVAREMQWGDYVIIRYSVGNYTSEWSTFEITNQFEE